jgi:DNA-binding NarL/FixJ family response regulator
VEGYIEKDATIEQLTVAINTIADGNRFFSKSFIETLTREGTRSQSVGKILSRREQEVLAHVLVGKTSKEIGDIIGLSPRTVEFHRANVMAKLGASSFADLVASARQRGLA